MRDYVLPFIALVLVVAWIVCFCTIRSALPNGEPTNPDAIVFLFSAIGALITSISIAELGLKDGTGKLRFGTVFTIPSVNPSWIQKAVALISLITWLTIGILCVVIWTQTSPHSTAKWPGGEALIVNHAKAWIGFAIAAVAAYFGIKK